MDGFLGVLKPPGMTSHDVVRFLRKIMPSSKAGHLGTLDPGASGVILIALGNATRLIEFFPEERKCYRAELLLGFESDTLDLFGNVSPTGDISGINFSAVEEAVKKFKGEILQTPPIFSAISKNGQRAYTLARKGVNFTLEQRKVMFHSIEIADFKPPRVMLDIACRGGTYIRSLCFDIGRVLGCGAVMSFLVRTESHGIKLEESFLLSEVERLAKTVKPADFLISPVKAFKNMPVYEAGGIFLEKILHGSAVHIEALKELRPGAGERILVFDADGNLAAAARLDRANGGVLPIKVFAGSRK
ncbi:MAG: tRNA pseudouridine(55) synthase TruB [Firmicutes bacterium]|nr:tRNA pseudouridine(55) synthase TruB [Bacillota bacterium]